MARAMRHPTPRHRLEPFGLADQPGGVRERAHGNRSVVGHHASNFIPRDQRRPGSEPGGAKRRDHAGGASAEHDHVQLLRRREVIVR